MERRSIMSERNIVKGVKSEVVNERQKTQWFRQHVSELERQNAKLNVTIREFERKESEKKEKHMKKII